MEQIRQGEIWLRRVEAPEEYEASQVFRRILLAHGETGNVHTLVGTDVRWLHDAVEDINELMQHGVRGAQEDVFVQISGEAAVIEHSERGGHEEAVLPTGVYQVTIKREQLPWEKEARWVAD